MHAARRCTVIRSAKRGFGVLGVFSGAREADIGRAREDGTPVLETKKIIFLTTSSATEGRRRRVRERDGILGRPNPPRAGGVDASTISGRMNDSTLPAWNASSSEAGFSTDDNFLEYLLYTLAHISGTGELGYASNERSLPSILGGSTVHSGNVANMIRRTFLRHFSATGILLSTGLLESCQSNADSPDSGKDSSLTPKWLYGKYGKEDFDVHVANNSNIAGEDYVLAHGAPLVSPVDGRVIWAKYSSNSGAVVIIDNGLLVAVLTHGPEETLLVKKGQQVDYTNVLMTQDSEGSLAFDKSHVHVTIAAFEALNDHPIVRQHDYDGRFDRARWSYNPNFLVEPSSMNDKQPLFSNPYDPSKHDRALEEHRAYVKKEITGRMRAISSDHGVNFYRVNQTLLTDRLNVASQLYRSEREKGGQLARDLENLLERERQGVTMMAKNRLVMSPFINPDILVSLS